MARSKDDPATRPLPPSGSLSSDVLYFINSKLTSRGDLDGAPSLLSELQILSDAIDRTLSELDNQLQSHLTRHSSYSNRVSSLFANVHAQLNDIRSSSARPSSNGELRIRLGKELQALAKEVGRVKTVRNYGETALKLDTLVGDIEDAVSSTMNRSLRRYPSMKDLEDMCAGALRALNLAEDVLSSVVKKHPQWIQLVSAVDHRIDRALAILRPQAISDHRALLASLGWPPPLSSSNKDINGSSNVQNPLFTMHGELKLQYCESFLALCGLQQLQRKRKSQQLDGNYKDVAIHQPLWVIEELVNPLSIASQRHFSKWIEKPEYIFALAYKITRDYADSMDDVLQLLVDEAMLSGYSCREEWISAMVFSLSTYLAKEIFPMYISKPEEESEPAIQSQARVSWLYLVDLMIAFDKQVQLLAVHSGMLLSFQEEDNMQKMSLLVVFCDRPDWLDLWAQIELSDTLDKLQPELEDGRNWINECESVALLPGQEESKAPGIASAVFRRLSSVIDRCRPLPSFSLRSRFLKSAGVPIIHKYLDCLRQRCQEAEGLTALTDDTALIKVAKSVNAGSFFKSVLIELCEDVFFLEIEIQQSGGIQTAGYFDTTSTSSSEATGKGIFKEEIKKLEEYRIEWIEKLSTVVLRGMDSLCREYIKNKKQWQEKSDQTLMLSQSFIEAMDYLQGKLSLLEEGLTKMDFTRLWRSLAAGIDKFIFYSILMGNVKFHDGGVQRLSNDLNVLFGVFGSWCLRPQGFFPKTSNGLKLLTTGRKELKSNLMVDERWLRDNGIMQLTAGEVEKIMKNRVFHT